MSRTMFVAGNWKMNTTRESGCELARAVAAAAVDTIDLAVFPPSVYLKAICDELKASSVAVGAQNMHFEDAGAFTGEISAGMIVDCGCGLVLLGHSERRHTFGESDEMINRKVRTALETDLQVILAVGELLEEREAEQTMGVNRRQIMTGLEEITPAQMARVTIAYEPVWAIGTGKTATPDQAQEVHAEIRALLRSMYGDDVADATRIQYGGSIKPGNAADLFAMEDIDGGLVGGASLKADQFSEIIKAALGS